MNASTEENFPNSRFSPGKEKIQVLVVEDDDSFREVILAFLKNSDREVSGKKNGKEAIQALQSHPFDLVVSDVVMPEADGMEVLREAKKRNPDCVVILITGYASLDSALQAIRGGAYDYLRKPFKLDQLEIVVKNAGEKICLLRENRRLMGKVKEGMEELKILRSLLLPSRPADPAPPQALDQKISEMDLLLKQMGPSDYEVQVKDGPEKSFQTLQKLIEYRRQGILEESEFLSLKKLLLQSLPS